MNFLVLLVAILWKRWARERFLEYSSKFATVIIPIVDVDAMKLSSFVASRRQCEPGITCTMSILSASRHVCFHVLTNYFIYLPTRHVTH